jgi:hypothetical protein
MKSEIPDGVPEDMGVRDFIRPGEGFDRVEPLVEDFAAVAAALAGARDALVAEGFADPPASMIQWCANDAWNHAMRRFAATRPSPDYPVSPFGLPATAESPFDKFGKALLDGATDEEIVAMARAARAQMKAGEDGEKWKRGDKE